MRGGLTEVRETDVSRRAIVAVGLTLVALTVLAIAFVFVRPYVHLPRRLRSYADRADPTGRRIQGKVNRKAWSLNYEGIRQRKLGNRGSALRCFRQALALGRSHDLKDRAAAALQNIAIIYQDDNLFDSAAFYYEQSRRLADESSDSAMLVGAHINRATLLARGGRLDSACALTRLGLAVARAQGDRGGEAIALQNLSTFYAWLNRRDSAIVFGAKALAVAREVCDSRGIEDIRSKLWWLGWVEDSIATLERARARLAAIPADSKSFIRVDALLMAAGAYARAGNPWKGGKHYHEALALARHLDYRPGLIQAERGLAALSERNKDE